VAAVEVEFHHILPIFAELRATILVLWIYNIGDNLYKNETLCVIELRGNMFTFECPLSSLDTAAHIDATIEQSVIASCAKSRRFSGTMLTSS